MKYIAHKEQEREQTIKEHLCGTAQLAGEFAEKLGKENGDIAVGKCMILESIRRSFKRKLKKIQIK